MSFLQTSLCFQISARKLCCAACKAVSYPGPPSRTKTRKLNSVLDLYVWFGPGGGVDGGTSRGGQWNSFICSYLSEERKHLIPASIIKDNTTVVSARPPLWITVWRALMIYGYTVLLGVAHGSQNSGAPLSGLPVHCLLMHAHTCTEPPLINPWRAPVFSKERPLRE